MRLFIVAGEASGDELGASLVTALRARGMALELGGVGGPALSQAGMPSLFQQSDIAVMGVGPVIARLPLILRRIRETAAAALAFKPDILITIDSPDFSKRVARKVRKSAPETRAIHWVCPSVWAWRPGRAKVMRPLYDLVLCLLPFEPAELTRLGGPPGEFVGHPLVERITIMRAQTKVEIAHRHNEATPSILILPGSRMTEIRRLMPVFLAAIEKADAALAGASFVIPTLPYLEPVIREMLGDQEKRFRIIVGAEAKYAAFRSARAALAASGTVTLELALAQIPMVSAYKVAQWEAMIARHLIKVSTASLPNLVLGEAFVPEFIQQDATPEKLGAALAAIVAEGNARNAQLDAFARLERVMRDGAEAPSQRVARVIAEFANR